MMINHKNLKIFPSLFLFFLFFYLFFNIIPENIPASYDILTLKPTKIHFPDIHNYAFSGGIYYHSSKKKFQYVKSEYDDAGKRIKEKVYDIKGNVKQIIRYYYNDEGLITREEFFNNYQEIVKTIFYKERSNRTFNNENSQNENYQINIHGKQRKAKKYHVEYNYNYNEKNQLISKIEYIYDASIDNIFSISNKNYIKIKSSIITYLNNSKIIEFYEKTPSDSDFVFRGAEVFEYIYPNKVYRIINIDRSKNVHRVVQYYYDMKYRIRKVSVYKPRHIMPWGGILRDTFTGDFNLNYFIIYSYNKKIFNQLIKRGISSNVNVGTDIPKYQKVEHVEGPIATKEFFTKGTKFTQELEKEKRLQEEKRLQKEKKAKEKLLEKDQTYELENEETNNLK